MATSLNAGESELDRAYNPRLTIPGFQDIFLRWSRASAATRGRNAYQPDLRYGASAGETLDYFAPARPGAPLLAFIHGGYWRGLDKADFSWIAEPYVRRGIAVAVLNYSLLPVVRLEQIVGQVRRALAWLYAHGDELGFDRNRIVCAGHSAGGHLTAMLMASELPSTAADAPAPHINAALAISGLFDLAPLSRAPFLRDDLRLTEDEILRLSPIHLAPAPGVRLVLACGALETEAFLDQSRALKSAWPRAVVDDVLLISGENHLTVCDSLARPGSLLFDAALGLLEN